MFDHATRAAIAQLPKGIIVLRSGAVIEELRLFREVAREKLQPVALARLERLGRALEPWQTADQGRRFEWSTADGHIETLSSEGEHQSGRAGHGRSLKGVVDFRWDLEVIGTHQRPSAKRLFALRNSSARIQLIDTSASGAGEAVSSWTFDVGDDHSPGCHFHAQFKHLSADHNVLFADVDVPRLPGLIFMPVDAIEFVIGELWQDEWRRLAASGTRAMDAWRPFPRERFAKLFSWYSGELKATRGTPWAQIKCAKPDPTLLLVDR